ncbi:thioesterase family protein [Lewinella sp. 4G2]|uniref:acyl-CoA thioesterase n=1 Tax=Lewinella sp. 4G2 TaxID=1803372 RepID=UPI0007B4BA18|nr:thioesterase family protein [Lewinella sp. 4G2]OAV44461.1 acyl-ACP thioesterase [Lewinella sp. 4G2]
MRLSPEDFKITTEFPTHWGDMDSARHINNIIYLRWAETARVIYFKAMGMNIEFAGAGAGAILAWQDCKYIFPMVHPDVAVVGVRCTEVLEDRFTLQTAVFTKEHGRIAAITHQSIVPYDYAKLKKVPMPQEWKDSIAALDGL